MDEWHKQIQKIIDEIDECIKLHKGEDITLCNLSRKLGYSKFHVTRKFKEISGMQFRDYLRLRKLAFALMDVREGNKSLLNIALDYGFSSHEAFTRAFKTTYGIAPSEYRKNPMPVVLRTKIKPFDRYILGIGEIGMIQSGDIKIYFVTIPAHKLLHIKNNESNGYWDFWRKQASIPGQDCETICNLLEGVAHKLDNKGSNNRSDQIMAYIHEPGGGKFECYPVPRSECYGVRLTHDYSGKVPSQMLLIDVPEAEYVVFEHGPFDFKNENYSVEKKVDEAMATFDFSKTDYRFDNSMNRVAYFYHDPAQFWKYIRPVRKK